MKWRIYRYKLELKTPFVLSYGSFDYRTAYIVSLEAQGAIGLGEATAITYYGWTEEVLADGFIRILEQLKHMSNPLDIILDIECLPLRHAFYAAWLDWQARMKNIHLAEQLGISYHQKIPSSSITISGDNYDRLLQQINQYRWPYFKLKLGTDSDPMKFDLIGRHPDKLFRIDANGGWTPDEVDGYIDDLRRPNIQIVEQPFADKDKDAHRWLKELIGAPLFIDETCQSTDDIEHMSDVISGVNCKLMKCGGWDQMLLMIRTARRHQLEVMVGCMTETSVGIGHAAQCLPLVNYADIDGSTLIQRDPATGLSIDDGRIRSVPDSGIGVKLKNVEEGLWLE